MSIQIYLKYRYIYENVGFCILCVDDFKILKLSNNDFHDFHRETYRHQPPNVHAYDVSRGQN